MGRRRDTVRGGCSVRQRACNVLLLLVVKVEQPQLLTAQVERSAHAWPVALEPLLLPVLLLLMLLLLFCDHRRRRLTGVHVNAAIRSLFVHFRFQLGTERQLSAVSKQKRIVQHSHALAKDSDRCIRWNTR